MDRVLGDNAAIVFHFNIEFIERHNLSGKFENLREFVRRQPVIAVTVGHPSLQKARLDGTDRAAAVDEFTRHMTDLCNVEMRGNWVSVRQHQTNDMVRMLEEACLEGA